MTELILHLAGAVVKTVLVFVLAFIMLVIYLDHQKNSRND